MGRSRSGSKSEIVLSAKRTLEIFRPEFVSGLINEEKNKRTKK